MEKKLIGFSILYLALNLVCFSQVDTTYIYNTRTPFGPLDIRIAKSATNYYYLQENKTFSFRESAPGVKTDTYRDMTTWDSSPYKEGNLREKTNDGDNFVMNYRLLIPQGYDASFAKGYPVVIILHGYGERGNCDNKDVCYHADRTYYPLINTPPARTTVDHELLNNDHNLLHGGKEHLSASNKAGSRLPNDPELVDKAFPGFVLFPQNLNGWDHFAVQDAIRMLRLIIKKYNINQNRVYIEGLSNGGHGVYEAIKRAPWLFAAAIAMSATDDGFINVQGMAHKTAHIPLWIFQGQLDITPYPSKTQRYIKQFRSAGADVRYTLYPNLGHGTWNAAMREPDFFSWLLDKNKSDIHSFENSAIICSEEGTKLEVGEGFKAYQWQFNGQLIDGANSSTYFAKNPGTYKARFSRVSNPTEAQWNRWSDPVTLTVESPPQAHIGQIGTVLLKDLNGVADARLQSTETHTHYHWYKDGVLLDLPSKEDDTFKVATIPASYGNGAYTLVVSDLGCASNPSAPKYVFFNNEAPVNIADPLNFAGYSSSPSENTLTWKDAATNENGYEIWRRKKINGTSFSAWEMAGITDANVTTFVDPGLAPMAIYHYKIRAVSNTGRSNYTPSGENEGLAVETVVDKQVPQAPSDLKSVPMGIQTLSLSWKPSTDNTKIREYYIYFNNDSVSTASADTTFLLTNMPLNKNFEISVKGADLSGNMSEASNTVKASTYFSGLYYEHSTGNWTDLDSIDWTWAEFTGTVKDFSLAPKTQDDYYNIRFDGFILIENPGAYQFRTSSDDGSRLWLNNKLLVDNDGIHDFEMVTSASISLEKGPQRIQVEFFDYIQSDSLLVEYKGPDTGNEWISISRQVLKSDESLITAVSADNGPEDSFLVSVYPNPATQDNINIQVQTAIPAPVQVRLIDPVGRSLFEGIFQPDEVSRGISISTPGTIHTGIYVVMVNQGKLRVRQKVVIKR
jgi:hypothetical protein